MKSIYLAVFDEASGRILQRLEFSFDEAVGALVVPESVTDNTHYVDTETLQAQELLVMTPLVSVVGTTVTVSGLPEGAQVSFNDALFSVSGGSFEATVLGSGEYYLLVRALHHKDWDGLVHVHG